MKGITYIAKRSRTLVGPNDIIAIANLAKKDKKAGNKIINASIGSFLDENGKLGDVPVVDDALKENITADLSYGPSSGDPLLQGSRHRLDLHGQKTETGIPLFRLLRCIHRRNRVLCSMPSPSSWKKETVSSFRISCGRIIPSLPGKQA
ncbi:MAG: hypothetical protein LKE52_00855 [Bacilli bacterium]|jgi:hypothetical protein|nr:hypothetical protein [Bacilli bacterium]